MNKAQPPVRVLVFPAGTEIGLEINAGLRFEKNFRIFGASSAADHGRYVFNDYSDQMPYVSDPSFCDEFNKLIEAWQIDVIFPAHDDVLEFLALNQQRFAAKIIAPSSEVTRICRSKSATYRHFRDYAWVPVVYANVDAVPHDAFPVFVKPDKGEGSRGARSITGPKELADAVAADPSLIIAECLRGPEFTVDCYNNADGELLFVGARERVRTRNGISVCSRKISLREDIERIAAEICAALKLTGPWFFQVKATDSSCSSLKLLEVAPRIAGTMALHRVSGVNFAAMAVWEKVGRSVSVISQGEPSLVDRALVNRYEPRKVGRAYVDLDDTLILGQGAESRVNFIAIALLYQLVSSGSRICLITRHKLDPLVTLAKFKIATALFDDIIWLRNGERKSDYINAANDVIFIDDSFSEREEVRAVHNIAVYAPDALEGLLDWRA